MSNARSVNAANLIALNSNEEALFKVVKEAADSLSRQKGIPELQLRVAGGWVRDKILKIKCVDIDLCVDSVPGTRLAFEVKRHLDGGCLSHSQPYIVKVNPEKSKHIESASINVQGMSVDFVQLRKETYTPDSRTPIVSEGDCESDAFRRDLTINSLFYNIRTNVIEDYTGRGLNDISHRKAETPLPAHQTFSEDPLRILRIIRFAAKLDLDCSQDILKEAKNPDIKDDFHKKISRERIQAEVFKILAHKSRVKALLLLKDMEMYDHVFFVEDKTVLNVSHRALGISIAKILNVCLSDKRVLDPNPKEMERLIMDQRIMTLLFLAAAMYPLKRNFPNKDMEVILRDSLRCSTKDATFVVALTNLCDSVIEIFEKKDHRRKTLGGFIVESNIEYRLGDLWPICVLFSYSVYLTSNIKSPDALKIDFGNYREFLSAVFGFGLWHCYKMKPKIDGRQVLQILDSTKHKSNISKALKDVMYLELEYPDVTVEECESMIRKKYVD